MWVKMEIKRIREKVAWHNRMTLKYSQRNCRTHFSDGHPLKLYISISLLISKWYTKKKKGSTTHPPLPLLLLLSFLWFTVTYFPLALITINSKTHNSEIERNSNSLLSLPTSLSWSAKPQDLNSKKLKWIRDSNKHLVYRGVRML